MPELSTLGALSGLAFVSGMRLYSTVLAVGLAVVPAGPPGGPEVWFLDVG